MSDFRILPIQREGVGERERQGEKDNETVVRLLIFIRYCVEKAIQ